MITAELDAKQELSEPLIQNTAIEISEYPFEESVHYSFDYASTLGMAWIGLHRDFVWSYLVLNSYDLFNGEIGENFGQTLTQMIITLPAVIIAGQTCLLIYNDRIICLDNQSEYLKKMVVFGVASLSTIPFWNASEVLGIYLGGLLSLDALNSDYFAGIFTGITETLWQNAFLIPLLLTQPTDRLATFFNVLGGAVWKWVITACLESFTENNLANELTIASNVAVSVAATTITMTFLAWLIKGCYDRLKPESVRLFSRSSHARIEETKEEKVLNKNVITNLRP